MTKFSIYIALFQSTQEPGNKPRFSTVCWSPQGALNYKGKLSVGQSRNLLSVALGPRVSHYRDFNHKPIPLSESFIGLVYA